MEINYKFVQFKNQFHNFEIYPIIEAKILIDKIYKYIVGDISILQKILSVKELELLSAEEKEKYNIILIEENLKKLSSEGEDTLIKIKDTPGYKIPVVLISNNKGFGMKEMYQEKGYKDVIFMPIKKNELLEITKKKQS